MSLLGAALSLMIGAASVGVTAGLLAPVTVRAGLVGAMTAVTGLGGAVVGAAALAGHRLVLDLPHLLPLSRLVISVDPLSGVFLLIVGGTAIAAGVYAVGYSSHPDHGPGDPTEPGHGVASRTSQAALPAFVAAMLLVPIAANVTTFLVFWELMALASLVLVLAEHRARAEVREAGIWYAAMTHAGLVVILLGLVVFAGAAGGESFAAMRLAAPELSPATRSIVFCLTFAGFASKAGVVPLHVWLPRAHPEAPSHVSALMSSAMVTLGLYGILRVAFDLLGGGPSWWGVLMLVVGALSAVYGVLQAFVATDLKRLLAYSTTENVGLMLVGVGAAGLFGADGNRTLAGLLLAAALLHAVNHAAFKTLLFLVAGSVLRSTGLRDLDRMGGLVARMPLTTALAAVGALCAAALPPGNGFVSEWLLLQGLTHSLSAQGSVHVLTAVLMPLAVGVVALTAGLGVATFVKAFGVGFLARARSPEAGHAVESPRTMTAGMVFAAAGCAALAVAPTLAAGPLTRIIATLPSLTGRAESPPVGGDAITLRLAGIQGSMSPALIALGLAVAAAVVAIAPRHRRARRPAPIWGCGGNRLNPRMEYTATSFAEPLTRVFDDVLHPEEDVDVTHHRESRYLIESVQFRHRVDDRIEARLYPPLIAAVSGWGRYARRAQNGSVHRYLGYGFVGLLLVLVVVGVSA